MLLLRNTLAPSVRASIQPSHIRTLHSTSPLHLKSFFKDKLQNSTSGDQQHIVHRTLPHPPSLFYHVVSDVSQYSEFVPYCTRSFINVRDPTTNEPTEAGIRVGWRTFDEEFVCQLQCDPHKIVIAESMTHSLFEHLYTKWTITPVEGRENSCSMELVLRYKFRSQLYNAVSAMFAESVSELVINAFDKRARELRRRERRAKV
ncbi:CYFA0S06e04566g1_1 [Cyberlindnera fabianii]|uniref:CYFA0S06e04566g1_1 n=1 Tax=Cyberlindnera fabianii TaxID=36022 RepID=A0A061AUC2_CYBFA|nr:Coenzyme Q-binding protein COQ10, mitochondrial [Cyberlindnera fabianii]CDR41236.1 CYFA0S06e04566g1_1 [Cyberlindnera fabianii]